MAKSKKFALRALELNENVPEAHTALGLVTMYHDWDLPGAGEHFRKALELNHGYVWAHTANAQRLALQGRIQEAITEAQFALELDPLSSRENNSLGWLNGWSGNDEKAVEYFERARELNPTDHRPYWSLGAHHCVRGMPEGGIPFLRTARLLNRASLAYCRWVGLDVFENDRNPSVNTDPRLQT